MTEKTKEELEQVPCIWYSVMFKDQTETLLDSESEVNTISQAFAYQLGLNIWKTNVRAQKIDGTTLETYKIVVSTFSMSDKDGKERFFQESFLLADVKLDIMLKMLFLIMSNVDVDFQARDIQWRSYTIGDILSTIKQVELIVKKKFAVAALNLEYKAFVVHITIFSVDSGNKIHPSKRAQITYLKVYKAPTKVLNKYADFADVFSLKLVTELSKHTEINNHAIELVDDWQL